MRVLINALAICSIFSMFGLVNAADNEFIEVEKSIEVNVGAEEVWKKIGDFCAIQDWHPAVSKCEAYDDHGSLYRTLTLADGGIVSEKHKPAEGNSYSYFIKKSPFPVKTYKGTLTVEGDGSKATVTWKARFKAKEAPAEEAKSVIDGVFTAGIESIQAMFK